MYLVHPNYLIGDALLPSFAIRAYAQVLCEDFCRWSELPVPHVVVTDSIPVNRLCESPTREWACIANAELFVASRLLNAVQLPFVLVHALMHLVPDVAEWVCDLVALDWMNYSEVPLVEATACAIARTPLWRARAMQCVAGQRVVIIGDALDNRVWEGSFLQVP